MSWAIDEHIGEMRPWPAFVTVHSGDEHRTYGPSDAMRESCHTKETMMYVGKPYMFRAYVCEHKGEDYGMSWRPRFCPLCGGPIVITGEDEWNG